MLNYGCKFEIYGTKGSIAAEGTIGQTEAGSVRWCSLESAENGFAKVPYEGGNMYTKEIEAFADAILHDTQVPVTAEEGLFDQQIVEAIYQSQAQGVHVVL